MFSCIDADRRSLDAAALTKVADGRVFTGRQALKNGLIDQLGGLTEARAWLSDTHGIDADLPLVSIEEQDDLPFISRLSGDAVAWVGTELASRFFGKMVLSEGLRLDGLVSVWHPEGQ